MPDLALLNLLPDPQSWPLLLWLGVAAILGLVFGSFANVVIYRLPLILRRQWGEENLPEVSLAWPGSFCPQCENKVRWHDNLPLLGWLLLKGRCRDCQAAIPWRYPLVELLCGVLAAWVAWRLGASLHTLAWMGLVWTLVVLAFIDAQTRLLPDYLTLPLIWAGLTWHWLFSSPQMFNQAFAGALLGYLSLWSLYWVFKLLTGREGMGYGDFKLLAALGAWLGAPALIPIVMLASVSGLIAAAVMKSTQQWKNQALPFGPHLVVGALALLLGGWELAGWLYLDSWLLITNWALVIPLDLP